MLIGGNHAGALNFGSSTVKGLDGQVVINAGNGTGTWSGVVRVNGATGTALAPVPNYSDRANTLGADADGGAVGVVPFKVHALASFPPTVGGVPGELRRWRSMSTPEASPCTPGSYPVNVVKIEHYGPISNAGTGVGLVDIQRRCDSQGTWTRAEELSSTIPGSAASLWDIQILPGVGGQPGRTLAIRPKELYRSTLATRGGQFRVRPLGDLKSAALLNNQTAGVGWTEFFFNLRQANPSDIAGPGQSVEPDGERTADDIIVFYNRFFAGDCRADIAGPGQSRVPDGELTADDIINFTNMYFSAVPCVPLP